VATWGEFEKENPELAAVGAERFTRHLMAWLGTTRPDGRPRVHPVTPLIADDGRLYVFMEPPSPKGRDLRANPSYALHCHVPDILGTAHGEFHITGNAHPVDSQAGREAAERRYLSAWSSPPPQRYILFEFDVAEAAGTPGGDQPRWTRWTASSQSNLGSKNSRT
jgi:hypothetical protein